jgi:hypothetical protein
MIALAEPLPEPSQMALVDHPKLLASEVPVMQQTQIRVIVHIVRRAEERETTLD